MVSAILTLFSVFCLLSLAEYLRYKKVIHGEIARKFVHITVGAFVSTWPHYMSLLSIEIICLAFLGGVLITRHLKILHSIHAVERKTWGDILFPIGIGMTALLAANPWIFTAAVLHLSLADGTAALIGERYIKAGKYQILGQTKSKVGTLVFWFVSFMILSTLILTQQPGLSFAAIPILLGLTTAATIVENAAPMGTDNILVPFVVTAVLNILV